MATFKDKNDREWRIDLTIGDLREVKSVTGLDFLAEEPVSATGEALSDLVKLGDCLWVLVRDQAPDDVDDIAFAKGFDSSTIKEASAALMQALIDFFPKPATKRALREGIDTILKIEDQKVGEAIKGFEKEWGATGEPLSS